MRSPYCPRCAGRGWFESFDRQPEPCPLCTKAEPLTRTEFAALICGLLSLLWLVLQ